MTEIMVHRRCRSCGGDLVEVLRLGEHRLNAFPQFAYEIDRSLKIPLILAVCTQCSLAQLTHTVPPDWMYRQYWYLSGVNESMVEELKTVVKEACAYVDLGPEDHVLDIGANDGTLLKAYADLLGPARPIRAAVEPAINLHSLLAKHTDILIPGYFPCKELDPLAGRFKIITAIACAYDLERPREFFEKIAQLLHPEGIAIIQFQDLLQQMQCAAFDNIVHEHLEYYTLGSLMTVVQPSLDVWRVSKTPINGGSLRVVLSQPISRRHLGVSVYCQLLDEQRAGFSVPGIHNGDLSAFDRFRFRVDTATQQILATLAMTRQQDRPIDWYGASTKSNCTLQVLGLGPREIRQAVDRNPEKQGRYTITGIPIVHEDQWRERPAPLTVVGIWQFKDFVLRRERAYLEQGGIFLLPLPQVTLIQGDR